MSQIISQYDSPENAQKTIERLRELGFGDEHLRLGSSPAERRWSVQVRPPFGTARMAMQVMQRFSPVGIKEFPEFEPGNDRTLISQLSGPGPPGAISELSRPKPVGAIAALSRRQHPGAIAVLSRRVSPGAIARLSAAQCVKISCSPQLRACSLARSRSALPTPRPRYPGSTETPTST